jgi:hypothetical protein
VTISKLIVDLDLMLKHEKNSTGRVAGPELSGEWMGKEILLCTSFICFQGMNDYQLEMGGRDDSGVNVRHVDVRSMCQPLELRRGIGIGRLMGENSLGGRA